MNRGKMGAIVLLIGLFLVSGCKLDTGRIMGKNEKPPLIKAQIFFSNGDKLTGYIEGLGVEGNSKVYAGGAALSYIYDKEGKMIGSYNYREVIYIKILKK